MIGKTLVGLNKEEALEEMTYANMALSSIYSQVDLHWAARGTLLHAASLLTNYFHKNEVILPLAIEAYFSLAWNELTLGRIAQSLTWLKTGLWSSQVINDKFIDEDKIINFDGCMAHLILSCNLKEIQEFEYLVDNLKELGLFYSQITLLYTLGYKDKVRELLESNNDEDVLKLMLDLKDYDTGHPTSKVLPSLPQYNIYSTKILGCEIRLSFPNKTPFIELTEAILTSLESFLATALIDNIIAKIPIVNIDIVSFEDSENLISHEYIVNDRGTVFEILCHPFLWVDLNQNNKPIIGEWFMFFIADVIDKCFIIKDSERTLKKLVTEDKIFARSMMFETCLGAIYNILGRNSHNDLLKKLTQGTHFPLLKNIPWDVDAPKQDIIDIEPIELGDHENIPVFDMEKHTHKDIAITKLIRSDLWDSTRWEGVGYMGSPDEPPYMFLLFKDKKKGLSIFEHLLKQLTHVDIGKRFRVSVIRGVDRENPAHYRVVLSENIKKESNAKLFTMIARIQTMEPNNDLSWMQFEESYNKFKSFRLAPAYMIKGNQYPEVEFDSAISIKEIHIKQAWEVGINDIEQIAIYPEDNILVPEGIVNPPFQKILESKEAR